MEAANERQKTNVSDEQIVELYWVRDEKAIEFTDNKYGQFLYRIAYNILHDRLDCEECQNDTYHGIWNCIPPNRPDVFSVFISRIFNNFICISGNLWYINVNRIAVPNPGVICE